MFLDLSYELAQVCDVVPGLHQTPNWVEKVFDGDEVRFSRLLEDQRRPGQWTDDDGIIVQVK